MRILAVALIALFCLSMIANVVNFGSISVTTVATNSKSNKNPAQDRIKDCDGSKCDWMYGYAYAYWKCDKDRTAKAKAKEASTRTGSDCDYNHSILATRSSGDNKDAGPRAFHSIPTPTIIIHITGEMANIMYALANGYALTWILDDEHNMPSNVIVKVLGGLKTAKAWESMRWCFPKLREVSFFESTTQEFNDRYHQQQTWLGGNMFPLNRSVSNISQTLDNVALVVANTSTTHPPPVLSADANITLPFVISKLFAGADMIDRFYDRLKDLFEYDVTNPDCCGPLAHPSEHIFHARGFEMEMGEALAKRLNMLELSPDKTVKELLRNHLKDDKIAVLSRFPSFGQLYVDRMRIEGLDARLVETINGEHSFCFLMSGKKEIVGSALSTFMKWASYLGNSSKARIYIVRMPDRAAVSGEIDTEIYNFTHPKLGGKILQEVYYSEEQDQLEQGRRLPRESLW